jgi:hypothetical protein
MSWSRSASFWLSCAGAVAALGCQQEPDLSVVGETTRLMRADRAPATSPLFDGKVLRLRGARGETLGVQLRLGAEREQRIRLELPPEAASVSAFAVRSLEVKEPSTDMYGPSRGPGVYPDVLDPVAGEVRSRDLAYFDVAIPQTAAPGEYSGRLLVDGRAVTVSLSVSRARIDLSKDPFVWVFYLPKEIARAHGLLDDDGPALLAREAEYHELFRAHGAFLAADLLPSRFEVRRHFVKGVKYWPVAIDTSSEEKIRADVTRWLEFFRGSDVTPFAIPLDEPRTMPEKLRARAIAEAIRRAGGGRPNFLCAVTDVQAPVYGDVMDVYLSWLNIPDAARARMPLGERYWTYNGRPPYAGSMTIDTDGVALRTWGWIAERYDVELWHAWEGLYWTDRYNRGGPTQVMHDPLTFDERTKGGSDFGNGDGVLAYPGPRPSLRLKALRRGLQDRLLLRELKECGGGATAARLTARLVPRALGAGRGEGSWSRDESTWEAARMELLDSIEKECDGKARALAD